MQALLKKLHTYSPRPRHGRLVKLQGAVAPCSFHSYSTLALNLSNTNNLKNDNNLVQDTAPGKLFYQFPERSEGNGIENGHSFCLISACVRTCKFCHMEGGAFGRGVRLSVVSADLGRF